MACCDGAWREEFARGGQAIDSFIRAPNDQSMGMRRMVLVPRVYIDTPATLDMREFGSRASTPIRCHPDQSSVSTIFDHFKRGIETAWNEKLCLVPGRPRRERATPLADCLMCSVDMVSVRTRAEADLIVVVAVAPEGRVICLTRPGRHDGTDMVLRFPETWNRSEARQNSFDRYEVSSRLHVQIDQNTPAHEFGHYLGLQHGCQRQVIDAALATEDPEHNLSEPERAQIASRAENSEEAYCAGPFVSTQSSAGQQSSALMNAGRAMVGPYGLPWAIRVPVHHDCTQSWTPRTTIEQVMEP